jgi:hypothetical protein
MLLVVTGDIHDLLMSCPGGIAGHTASHPVTVRVADHDYQGWIRVPAEPAKQATDIQAGGEVS